MNSRLQQGTTPGNPEVVAQWQAAQNELDSVATTTSQMVDLSNRIAANADLANYLFESTRAAFEVQGAVDEDHRQLTQIEDQLNQSMVKNDHLLTNINQAIGRENGMLFAERRNLKNLALAVSNGRIMGPSLANLAAEEGMPGEMTAATPSQRGPALVVIRFDRPDVDYEDALYTAVSTALERQPNAHVELVSVTPLAGGPSDVAANAGAAKRNAERVMRSLVDMGMPADRISLTAASSNTARTNEVQVFLR